MASPSEAFRARALREAERYGSDPWVFVRELLQNARDAGARRIDITVEEGADPVTVSCRDDGSGMSIEHARRFLFGLYASSKGDPSSAGRFGVGFWAILRFCPRRITIRSSPPSGPGWEVVLNADLNTLSQSDVEIPMGTEVILERPRSAGPVLQPLRSAAARDARFLTVRGSTSEPLPVHVNEQPINESPELPPPSVSFRRRGLVGSVGLGPEPSVEVVSKGLLLRRCSALSELLLSPRRTSSPLAEALPDGLVPRVRLRCDLLEPMLARADMKENRALRRMVQTAQRELDRLVVRQLDALRPPGTIQRFRNLIRERMGWGPLLGGLLLLLAGTVLAITLAGRDSAPVTPSGPTVVSTPLRPEPSASPEPPSVAAYRDLGDSYSGPQTDAAASQPLLALSYLPADASPLFAALRLDPHDTGAAPISSFSELPTYRGPRCEDDCLEIRLSISSRVGPHRLPVASGHRIDPETIRWNELPLSARESPAGQPVIWLETGTGGVLSYASRPAPEHLPSPRPFPELRERAAPLLAWEPTERIERAAMEVRRLVRYDRSDEVVRADRDARERGLGLVTRALEIGAGDCDIQNGLLAAYLQTVGIPARLAVGFVGVRGTVIPGLHAWVEYEDDTGMVRVVDASATPRPHPIVAASVPTRLPIAAAPPPELLVDPTTLLALLLLPLAVVVWTRRTRRTVRLAPQAGLAPLIRGALQQPEAYGHLPSIMTRPLIPQLEGSALSVARCRHLAVEHRLFVAHLESPLAHRARRAGVAVIDGATEEGAAVADALSAIDLDVWDRKLGGSTTPPHLVQLNARLRRHRVDAEVRLAAGGDDAVQVLDLGPLSPRTDLSRRYVLLDPDAELHRRAQSETRPELASFCLLEGLMDHLDLSSTESGPLLAATARDALEGRPD